MIRLGTTLKCNQPPYHYWVVLSEPERTGGRIVIVNITTLTDRKVDDECILTTADFSLLNADSVVAFS